MVFSMGVKMSAAVLLGASPLAVLVSETALNLTAMFNHANIGMPMALDRVLRWCVVTPDMHRVHHSVHTGEMTKTLASTFRGGIASSAPTGTNPPQAITPRRTAFVSTKPTPTRA